MNKRNRFRRTLSFIVFAVAMALATMASAETFRFGVMSDTQWKANLDSQNPNTVAVGIINKLNQQFIDAGVQFVIQVGDLTDKESAAAMQTRAEAAKTLCDNGVAFFPLRGNHEGSQAAALQFQTHYPQTIGSGSCFNEASNFTSPFDELKGLSYSFDYANARFILLDQFTRTNGTNYHGTSNDNILDQQNWIDIRLSSKGSDKHAFLFSHKNLIGANHTDMILGANPAANPDGQNAYYISAMDNGVRYHFGGHDHNHMRSLVLSPDGKTALQNIIASSNSYKFYTPQIPSLDEKYSLPAFGFLRETPIVQELYTVGYYIVTVEGPRVTVDHYASDNGCGGTLGHGMDCDLTVTPNLTFEKRETFGYSLNGQEFLVPQGESYAVVQDSFEGTTAMILDGKNESNVKLYDGRATTKDVNTGWTSKSADDKEKLASNILTLWGLSDLGSDVADTYALSISYDKTPKQLGNGAFGIAAKTANGKWVNAVNMNMGGGKNFVHGAWKPSYGLGTYGVDPATKSAWAVVNFNGDFAVAREIEPVPGHRK